MYMGLKKYFSFLQDEYGFTIHDRKTSGSYYYFDWTNGVINIKVLFDFREASPLTIITYPSFTLGTWYDSTRYSDELVCGCKRDRDKVKFAAMWLREAIQTELIDIRA